MIRPDSIKKYEDVDLKLGIKSSLPHPKSTLALLFLLWESNGHPADLIYAEQDGAGLTIETEVFSKFVEYLRGLNIEIGEVDRFRETVNSNQLLKSQLEALIVAFELIWRVARIEFVDAHKPNSAERTGGVRYPKKIRYTANMDIIDTVIKSDEAAYIRVLLEWLGVNCGAKKECDDALCQILTVLSENAIFKYDNHGQGVMFNQNCIYEKCIAFPDSAIDISGDLEAKGPLRILKTLVGDNLNKYLRNAPVGIIANTTNADYLADYQKRVTALLELSSDKIAVREPDEAENTNDSAALDKTTFVGGLNYQTNIVSVFPRNRIVFGAPGTGKSFSLNNDRKTLLDTNTDDFERVTFHPEYSYSQFVGCYKPLTDKDGNIRYEFVPGPFMRILAAALNSGRTETPQPFLLLIEEINRAKVAAVFGEVFQLLDRNDQGYSQYEIHATEDVKQYLAKKLGGVPDDYTSIRIPDNMFIWATMNSADQGVFPMDTAFKRRWDFEYIGIDDNDSSVGGLVEIGKDAHKQLIDWNVLRKSINEKLAVEFHINEDKLMGPFFLGKSVFDYDADTKQMKNPDAFKKAFKSKVLMYLYEDAAKPCKHQLFSGCDSSRYSSVCTAFDETGLEIFGTDFQALYDRIKGA